MKDNLLELSTEARNSKSMCFPKMSVEESTVLMNHEDENCAKAVKAILPVVNQVIKKCIATIQHNGRVVFIGAAHSGYLGALDAFEANATFGTTNEFTSIVAGNPTDIMKTDGSAEDHIENAQIDLQAHHVDKNDFVIGISSSGRTPYVIGALTWCREQGISCACLVNNEHSLLFELSDYCMAAVPGAEVISGSTRLKAGTCQKMILNMITTVCMAQLGNVYENLMINVPPVSKKMRTRLEYIMTQATSCTMEHAHEMLVDTDYSLKAALLMEIKNITKEEAFAELVKAGGNINALI